MPSGVNVHKQDDGWRVRLGKRFTGGAVVRKRFDTLADARSWIDGQAGHQSHIQATALTPSQLAEAKDAFTKLDGASLTEAVGFYLANAKPAGGTKKLEEAIDALLKSKANAGRSRPDRDAEFCSDAELESMFRTLRAGCPRRTEAKNVKPSSPLAPQA